MLNNIRQKVTLLVFACFSLLLLGILVNSTGPVFHSSPLSALSIVVIDPGHGGEDGGAVSPEGIPESPINLAISQILRDLFLFSGQPVVMTREENCALDSGEATIRQRKTADLKRRVQLVNDTPSAFLLSIHQNSLPSSPVTHGAQVFWNPAGREAAQRIQSALNLTINPGNEKHDRQIPSAVYLMKHIQAPGILVECGFLSNPEELDLLRESDYQRKLALTIAAGYLCAEEEIK